LAQSSKPKRIGTKAIIAIVVVALVIVSVVSVVAFLALEGNSSKQYTATVDMTNLNGGATPYNGQYYQIGAMTGTAYNGVCGVSGDCLYFPVKAGDQVRILVTPINGPSQEPDGQVPWASVLILPTTNGATEVRNAYNVGGAADYPFTADNYAGYNIQLGIVNDGYSSSYYGSYKVTVIVSS
jgi:hypothetical protein